MAVKKTAVVRKRMTKKGGANVAKKSLTKKKSSVGVHKKANVARVKTKTIVGKRVTNTLRQVKKSTKKATSQMGRKSKQVKKSAEKGVMSFAKKTGKTLAQVERFIGRAVKRAKRTIG